MGWCLLFVWKTSFRIDGERYFCLFDDVMISMTYARNLVEGYGLTWARWGEPVEGFTHPLWTFALVLAQWPFLPLELRPLLVQAGSLVLLVLHLFLIHRLARLLCTTYPSLAWVAPVATAAYFPLNYWALVGMESALQAVLTTLAVLLAFHRDGAGGRPVVRLWCLFAVAALLRLDMLLMVTLVLAWVVATGGLRTARPGAWLRGVLLFTTMLGGYQVFRQSYYGGILPNTYWLKMTGGDPYVRIARGLTVFTDMAPSMVSVLLLALGGGLLTAVSRRRHLLLVALVGGYFAYSVYVGGDVYEGRMTGNRFTCFVVPLLTVLAAGVADAAVARWPSLRRGPAWMLPVVLGGWLCLDVNGLLSGQHRDVRWGYLRIDGPPFLVGHHERVLRDLLRLKAQVPPRTRVAVIWAGIPAYYSDFRMIDCLGYNDREVAAGPWANGVPRDRPRRYLPGHMKHDLDYTLRRYEPEIFFQWLPAWRHREPTLTRAGYRRYRTGPTLVRTAGEIWMREPLVLDVSPWRDDAASRSG